MQFICNKNAILREISVANEIISARNALSSLSGVLIDAREDTLTIKATDLKVSFETQIPITLEKPGSSAVFCGKLLGILKSLPDGNVSFIKKGDKLGITSRENIRFQLYSISADSFPELPSSEKVPFFFLPQKEFLYMIGQTIFAISEDETRYFMNGVLMESNGDNLLMVATDGRRLSHVYTTPESKLPNFAGIIIPPKVLNLISKLASGEGDVKLAVADKLLFVKFDKQKLTSTLVDGQFPNYSRVIPENQQFKFTVNRIEFEAALRRVSLLSDQKTKKILLSLSQEAIVLKSDEREVGEAEETIKCHYEGPEKEFALNHSYLTDPLKVIEQEYITVKFTDSKKAITIVSLDESTFFHIVMPMQME